MSAAPTKTRRPQRAASSPSSSSSRGGGLPGPCSESPGKSRSRRVLFNHGSSSRSATTASEWQTDSSPCREEALPFEERQDVTRARTMVQLNLFGRATINGAAGMVASEQNVHSSCCASSQSLPALNECVERSRAPKRKLPEGPRGRAKCQRVSKETHVSLQSRVKQFENEGLKVSAGELFCSACLQALPNISESIKRHIATTKHKERLVKMEKAKAKDEITSYDLADFFTNNSDLNGVWPALVACRACSSSSHMCSRLTSCLLCTQSTLDARTHVKRFKVVQTFLLSGTPLSRLSYFRSLLEPDLGVSLPHETHLAALYLPRIEETEFGLLRQELRGQFVGIAFDGTSRLGEAVNITGRWCTADFYLEKRLLRFITAKTHVNSTELASLITCALCTELAIPPHQVWCVRVHDIARCSCALQAREALFDAPCSLLTHLSSSLAGRVLSPHPHSGRSCAYRVIVRPLTVLRAGC